MKKQTQFLLIFVAFMLAAVSVNAQTCPKGAIMLGGSAGVTSVSSDGESEVTFFLSPTAGFFVIDDLAIGANLGVAAGEGFSQFGLGPFARYYVLKGLFLQANLNFTSTKFDGFDSDSSTRFGGALGYSLFLNDGVALEPALAFDFGDGITIIGLTIGVQAFLKR